MRAMPMKTITVISVEPFTPGDESASVTLRSQEGAVVTAFCWPCTVKVGDTITNRLSILDGEIRAAFGTDWPQQEQDALSVESLERIGHFKYRGTGRVIDQDAGLVAVNGYVIEFGSAPCDGYAQFEIDRLDIRDIGD
ncbi:hypothetical protein [Achromobacter anxifer]